MKSLAKHITEGLKSENTPLLEEQVQTVVKETNDEPETPESILDIAGIAPEKDKGNK